MAFKINDFKLAEFMIKAACKLKGVSFVNLDIIFDKDNPYGYSNGTINVGTSKNIANTINNIVMFYFMSFKDICGCELFIDENHKSILLNCLSSFLRGLCFCKSTFKKDKSNTVSRLSDFSLVSIIMRDIICPAYNIRYENVRVIEIDSYDIDVALLVKENEKLKKYTPFIFSNLGIEDIPCRDAFLLTEAIKSIEKCPIKTLQEILPTELKNKILGIASLEYKDENEVKSFMSFLETINEIENNSDSMLFDFYNKNIKTAQAMDNHQQQGTPWWFLGLIEKMIAPARGSDWSTYTSLHPYFKELWDRIEAERAKRGREGLTYEKLLRIQSGENTDKSSRIMEKVLSDERVW